MIEDALAGIQVDRVLYVKSMASHGVDMKEWLRRHPLKKRLTPGTFDSPSSPSSLFGATSNSQTQFYVLAAGVGGDKNAKSIVLLLNYRGFEAMLTGDATYKTENVIRSRYGSNPSFIDVDLLKLGHHGSNSSSRTKFLELVKPEVAVASAAHGSNHQHPRKKVIDRVAEFTVATTEHNIRWGVKEPMMRHAVLEDKDDYDEAVYGTSSSGTIVVTSNGTTFKVAHSSPTPTVDTFAATPSLPPTPPSGGGIVPFAASATAPSFAPFAGLDTFRGDRSTPREATLPVPAGTQVVVILKSGQSVKGEIQSPKDGWVQLKSDDGSLFVRLTEIDMLKVPLDDEE